MYGFKGKFKIIRKVKWIKLTQDTRNDIGLIKTLKISSTLSTLLKKAI